MGRVRENKLVFFDGELGELWGKVVNVKVEMARSYTLFGRMVG